MWMFACTRCFRDIDEAIAFCEALGFERTYRQVRPNPSAVVERGDMGIHLFGMDGFNPADSYGSVIIQVSDPDALYQSFAAVLRTHFGKLPTAGIPRILRPRKRQGTVYGFTVVDVGGNWLRISRLGDTEEMAADEDTSTGLARVISNAARQGDARGDHANAIRLIGNGLRQVSQRPRCRAGPGPSIGPNWPVVFPTPISPGPPLPRRRGSNLVTMQQR